MTNKHYGSQNRNFKCLMGILLSVLLLCSLFVPAYAEESVNENGAAEESAAVEEAAEETAVVEEAAAAADVPEAEAQPEEDPQVEILQPVKAAPAPGGMLQAAGGADSEEDVNFINVQKKFKGLPEELIPENFQISVTSGSNTFLLKKGDTTYDFSKTYDADNNVVWQWKIKGVGTGIYSVSESNAEVDGYDLESTGLGKTVEVKAADMTVNTPVHETTCSHENWPVMIEGDSNVLFAATLTQGGVAVISKTPLSASQRAAVETSVLKIKGPWKTPVYFYSIEEQVKNGVGFNLNGAKITYNAATEEVIISATSNWQHVATLEYSISEASNPDIGLTNTYTRNVADVNIKKLVTGNMGDTGKNFDFTVSVKTGDKAETFKIGDTEYAGTASFSLKHDDDITLTDVPVGATVTVTETDYSGSKYTTTYAVDDLDAAKGLTASLEVSNTDGHSIIFTNNKEAIPDTGVLLDSLPYILILGVVIIGAAVILMRRRSRYSD